MLPSDLDSLTPPPAGEAAFVIAPHPTTVNRLTSARVAVTWGGAPRIRLTEDLIKETWGVPPCVSDTDAGDHRDCVPEPAPATPTDYVDNLDVRLMYRLAYRNFGGNPVQESLVGNITVTRRKRAIPSMERSVGTSLEMRAVPRPLLPFSRRARMIPTARIAGWDRSRWTKTTTSRSATANRA